MTNSPLSQSSLSLIFILELKDISNGIEITVKGGQLSSDSKRSLRAASQKKNYVEVINFG